MKEYHVQSIGSPNATANLTKVLNQAAEKGWEVLSVNPTTGAGMGLVYHVVFMKDKK